MPPSSGWEYRSRKYRAWCQCASGVTVLCRVASTCRATVSYKRDSRRPAHLTLKQHVSVEYLIGTIIIRVNLQQYLFRIQIISLLIFKFNSFVCAFWYRYFNNYIFYDNERNVCTFYVSVLKLLIWSSSRFNENL